MKSRVSRHVFTAILLVCAAALLFLCIDGRTLSALKAEVRHPRQNGSLYAERRDGGVVYIGGEGALSGDDMLPLVESLGKKKHVTDIIIGDGITEIGYNAIVEYEAQRTLRLGRGVQTVHIGAIKNCEALEYVFLPAGLRNASRDFLYSCNNCLVVTDGTKKELPRLRNVKKSKLLTEVDSLEALQAALGDTELPEALKQWWQT